jgi:hypothetical protein
VSTVYRAQKLDVIEITRREEGYFRSLLFGDFSNLWLAKALVPDRQPSSPTTKLRSAAAKGLWVTVLWNFVTPNKPEASGQQCGCFGHRTQHIGAGGTTGILKERHNTSKRGFHIL